MIEELNVFLPKSKTESLVEWLFGEIEALKSKRRVPTDSPRRKKEKKKKKKSERRKEVRNFSIFDWVKSLRKLTCGLAESE